MINRKLKTALAVLSVLLLAELAFIGYMHLEERNQPQQIQTQATTETTTEASTEAVTEETTEEEPTTEETTEATEEEQTRFLLTFLGDCTLGSTPSQKSSPYSFIQTIGEDYNYPFRNVVEILENDDFTIANLEVVLGNKGSASQKLFNFRGPAEYTNILTGSSVEAVTLANNHTMDFGQAGYDETKRILEDAQLPYVEKNGTCLVTTEGGLTIGIYAAAFSFNKNDMAASISSLRKQGAEIVICAFHWGEEGKFRPNGDQEIYGKAAIDAGADIVYGHHPHVLQKIEEYKDGVICYSLGNFSFGGNNFPGDYDSAIVQLEVIREEDGSVRLGERTIIPVRISSNKEYNNFQPMLYEEGSKEYDRVLSKLDGSYKGADLNIKYEDPNETKPDEGEDETTGGDETGDSGETGDGETGGETEGDTGSGSTGGEIGDPGSGDTGTGGDAGAGGDTGGSGGSGGEDGGTPAPEPDPAPEE